MLKRIGSLSAALVMMFNSCPSLVAEATETSQNAWKEKVLFEENFETEVTYEEGASEYIIGRNTTDVYSGWKTGVSGSASVYADDTVFSLLKEGDNQVFTHSRTLGTKGTSGYSNTTFSKAFNITGNKEKPVRFKMKMKAEPSVGAVQISFGGATWLFSHASGKVRLYSGAYDNAAYTNHSFADNEWHEIELLIDFKGGTYKYYIDGIAQTTGMNPENGEERKLNNAAKNSTAALSAITISTLRGDLYGTAEKKYYIDDIFVANLEERLTGEAACEEAANTISKLFENPLTQNVTLPSTDENGTAMTSWLSSDESVITNTGVITRDYDEDKSADITVNISNGDFSKDYTFTATIKKADPVYEENVVLNDSFENPEISQTTLIAPGESFNGWIRQNAATGTGFKYEIASEGDNQFLRYYHTGSDIGSYITFKKALTQTIPAKSKIELSFKMKKESGYNGLFEITLGKAAFLFRMSHNYMYPGMYSNSANTAVASVDSDEWNDIKFVIWDTEENGTYEYYLNGVKVTAGINGAHSGITDTSLGEFSELSMRCWTGSNAGSANKKLSFDDIKLSVFNEVVPDASACKRVSKTLENLFSNPLTENITLPLTGEYNTSIAWQSSNEAVITNTGIITRAIDENMQAVLTATISRGEGYSKEYSFIVNVKEIISDEKACRETYEYYSTLFQTPLEDNVDLSSVGLHNASVEWTSSDEEIITNKGRITRALEDKNVTLSAVITKGETARTETFTVTVKGIGSYTAPTQEILQKIADGFMFSDVSNESPLALSKDLDLFTTYNRYEAASIEGGVKIDWASSDNALLSKDGVINPAVKEAKNVTLTATFKAASDESISAVKTFSLTLLPKGKVYFYETFDNPIAEAGTGIEKYNGWSAGYSSPTETINVYDSFYTVEKETDTNKVFSFYRPTSNASSIMRTATKKLAETIDGGEVSLRMRVKRKKAANSLIVWVKDSQDNAMSYNLEFSKSRIRHDSNLYPIFNMHTTASEIDKWQTLEFIFKLDEQKFDCYHDGVKIAENLPIVSSFNGTISSFVIYSTRNMGVNDSLIYVDDIVMTKIAEKIADNDAAEKVARGLEEKFEGMEVSEDFPLETAGDYKSTILWRSSNSDVIKVINQKGVVTGDDNSDTLVTLTAEIIRGGVKKEKEVNVKVPSFGGKVTPTEELLSKAADNFTFDELTDEKETLLTHDLTLPSTYNKGYGKKIGGINILWSSSKPNVVTNEGKITKQKYDAFLTLSAEFSAVDNPSLKVTKEFEIAVLAEGEFVLNDGFEDASFDLMNKTFAQTGKQLETGSYRKEIYDGWALIGTSPGMEMYTDTVLKYFPENPYERVYNYTRKYRGNSAGSGYSTPNVTFTYKELDKEYQSGTLYVSSRFYLTNANSRIEVMIMDTKGSFSSTSSANCNIYYCAGQNLTTGELKDIVSLNKWHTLTFVMHLSGDTKVGHRYDVFIDGVKINKNQLVTANGYPIYSLAVSSVRTSDGPDSSWYADDIMVRHVKYDVTEDVKEAASMLSLSEQGPLSTDIVLPSEGINGTRILWSSSDENVISSGGKVYFDGKNHSVTLTATIIKENVSETKSFTVSVAGSASNNQYEIVSLKKTDGILTGATVKNKGFSGNAVLITRLYSRGDLMEVRLTPLLGTAEEEVTFTRPLDTKSYLKYNIKSYIYDVDNNTIISNICF